MSMSAKQFFNINVFIIAVSAMIYSSAHADCLVPANSIVAENCQTGNPPAEWDIDGSGDSTIQGFTTDISFDIGQTVNFKVKTTANNYRLDIYRLGYYQGNGARKIATVLPSATLPQTQPACLNDTATGLIDCGNWAVSASWLIPANAVSGVYFARAVRTDTGGASHIYFIVRNDSGHSDLLFQTADTTWQAYNDYGGNSLYTGSPAGRAYKVSYNRPFVTRGGSYRRAFLFGAEIPMIRWLESNGYDVSYFSGVDTDRRGAEILEHKVFLSVGHDEYWSGQQRTNVENARNNGINLAFFSGNEVFWKTRWEPSIDGSATSHRTLVSYKETHANAKIDPSSSWTGTWRDPRFSPPADGGRPENALTGTIFTVNCCIDGLGIEVPEEYGKLRFWSNTDMANLLPGQIASTPPGTLGYEWDEPLDNGFSPQGLIKMSSTSVNMTNQYLLNNGSTYGAGTATHSLTMYRHPSGALVFGAGTIRWSWGLDGNHDTDFTFPGASTTPDRNMQQATVNLFADMGNLQPGSIQPGLVAAVQSMDLTPPVSSLSSPTAGSVVHVSDVVTISGTANDVDGRVANVEVSGDGGATWHTATGRNTWTYNWVPQNIGFANILVRAIDDSGNQEINGPNINLTVEAQSCPCTIWDPNDLASSTPIVASANDSSAVELGVKFSSDVAGTIKGIRFYKGPGNTGEHVGNLWTSDGILLASAAFTSESSSGWQQVTFANAVAVEPNVTYIASYFAPNGGYSVNQDYFLTGFNRSMLHAQQSTATNANGVFKYGVASQFPTDSFRSSNYWVDVVFDTTGETTDTTPPTIVGVTPSNASTGVGLATPISVTFNEAMKISTITGATVQFLNSGGSELPASVSYNTGNRTATITPSNSLLENTLYQIKVIGGSTGVADLAGNPLSATVVSTFTTGTAVSLPQCPCSLWTTTTVPNVTSVADPSGVELGLRFSSESTGTITGIKFYKGAGNTGTHIGNLWTNDGQLLATAVFSSETPSGWQQVSFANPVSIAANTTYIASYYAPNGNYAANSAYFANAGFDNAPLHAPVNSGTQGNGVYAYGPASLFPNQTFNSTNYWVDVVFNNTDTTPPSVSQTTPVPGSTGVAVNSVMSATFSKAMDASTVNAGTIQLSTSGGAAVASTITYNPADRTVTVDPASDLAEITQYQVKITGGSGGVKDSAQNALANDFAWSFTTADISAPTAPGSLTAAAISPTQINLAWNASSDNVGVAGYVVERCNLTAGCASYQQITTTATTSYSDNGLSSGVSYQYRVKAFDAAGNNSAFSLTASNSTPDNSPPTTPVNLTATGVTASQIGLAWTASTDNVGVTGYRVERCQEGISCPTFSLRTTVATPAFTDTGLPSASAYQYRVYAVDAAGNTSPNSNTLSVRTSDITPPSAPAFTSVTAVSSSQINLSWTTSTDNVGVTGYQLERCNVAACTYALIASPTGTSFNDSGLSFSTAYNYRVRAVDAAGNVSPYSVVGSATTLAAPIVSTGYLSPASNSPVITSSGDNNGFQTSALNAYGNDSIFASDINSGTSNSSSCASTGKDRHVFGNFGLNIPAGVSIKGIQVRLDARVDSQGSLFFPNAPKMCVEVSWNGGTNWVAAKTTPTLATVETTYILGAATDVWGRTWAAGDFTNTNFKIRITNVASGLSGANARDFYLDWAAVQVTYQ